MNTERGLANDRRTDETGENEGEKERGWMKGGRVGLAI